MTGQLGRRLLVVDQVTRSLRRQDRQLRVKRAGAALTEFRLWWCWRVLPVLGSMMGLGCLVVAMFTISATIGLVALGVVLFIAEWRVRG